MNAYADAAVNYLIKGYTPIPLRGKIPRVKGWQNLSGVTGPTIRQWAEAGLFENIGLLCGEASNNLVVIDFDGLAGYAAFCEVFPELAATYTVLTGSGRGKHLYFTVDLLPESSEAMNTPIGNIELRANGRSIVAVPSIHPDSGQHYVAVGGHPVLHLTDLAKVEQWVNGFRPAPPKSARPTPPPGDGLNPKILDALYSFFTRDKYKLDGPWVNCSCPKSHNHKHGDRNFSFGYHSRSGTGHCFACGGMNAEELCTLAGVDVLAMGGFFGTYAPPSPNGNPDLGQAPSQNGSKTHEKGPNSSADPLQGYIGHSEALTQQMNELNEDAVPMVKPMINPYRFLHRFGGLGHVLTAGQLMYLASTSGGGKTIGGESGWEALALSGTHSWVWTPEWVDKQSLGQKIAARAIQRGGGPSFNAQMLHKLYLNAKAQGTLTPEIEKYRMSDADISRALAVGGRLMKSSDVGQILFSTAGNVSIEQLICALLVDYETAKAQGIVLGAAWLDFAQLLWLDTATKSGQLWIEQAMNQFKQVCSQLGLVGFVTSQMKKGDAENIRNGDTFDASQMQWLSEQQANLVLMFAPATTASGAPVMVDDLHTLRARIVKDSLKGPSPEFTIYTRPERLSWELDLT